LTICVCVISHHVRPVKCWCVIQLCLRTEYLHIPRLSVTIALHNRISDVQDETFSSHTIEHCFMKQCYLSKFSNLF
jgi:hypothetical protein